MLRPGEKLFTLTAFPTLGCPDSLDLPRNKTASLRGPVANSEYVPDEIINLHIRFPTLTKNIRERRGSNVDMRTPIFKDRFTAKSIQDIKMDAMCFGMGCSCLQVTFQACSVDQARYLYDALAVVSSIAVTINDFF